MTRFAVVYQDTRAEHDYYAPNNPTSRKIDVLEEFDSQEELLEWINENDARNYKKLFRAFKLEELVVERKVSINLLTK
jgi:hypothetical protein